MPMESKQGVMHTSTSSSLTPSLSWGPTHPMAQVRCCCLAMHVAVVAVSLFSCGSFVMQQVGMLRLCDCKSLCGAVGL